MVDGAGYGKIAGKVMAESARRRRSPAFDDRGLVLDGGTRIGAGTVVWAAGVQAAPLAGALDVKVGSHGRIPASPALQLAGHCTSCSC